MFIPFNQPSITDLEKKYVLNALNGKLCGDGDYTKKVNRLLNEKFGYKNFLLTCSGTQSLELSALIAGINPGDEILMPSFTFVSTANAFLMRGAVPVFCEIDPQTMNIDPEMMKQRITSRTKAIVVVHYAGVCCDMDKINEIGKKNGLVVIEDAAQAVGSTYKNNQAGTLSSVGCFSFHDTKNYVMGEGGGIIVRDNDDFIKAEIIREKGTDRSRFLRGDIDKYTWQSIGSSFLPSDLLAALLFAQIERHDEILGKRMAVWNSYNEAFAVLERQGYIRRPVIPAFCKHNAHMYYLIAENHDERNSILVKLKNKGIQAVFHYVPLHSSPMGLKLGNKPEDLQLTENLAGRLLRLPLWSEMTHEQTGFIIDSLIDIFKN